MDPAVGVLLALTLPSLVPGTLSDTLEMGEIPPMSDTFPSVRNSSVHLDRTKLIKWFLSPACEHAQVLLAPSQFGKTVNLDMIRSFLHPAHVGHSPKEKTDKEALFKGLNIMTDGDFVLEHFLQHPVLYFNFGNIEVRSMPAYRVSFSNEVRRVCQQIANLTSSKEHLDNTTLKDVCSRADIGNAADTDGKLLVDLFKQIYKKNIIVLVDGVTDPVTKVWYKSNTSEEKLKAISYRLGQFLANMLQNNENVDKGLLTAVTRLGGTFGSTFTGIKYKRVLDDRKFSKFFGLSERDVKQFETLQKLGGPFNETKQWYGGYGANKKRYPFSPTLKQAKQPANVSIISSMNFPFKSFLKYVDFAGYVDESITEGVKVKLVEYIEVTDLIELRKYLFETKSGFLRDLRLVNIVLQTVMEIGVYNVRPDLDTNRDTPRTRTKLKVPNLRMKQDLQEVLKEVGFVLPKGSRAYVTAVGALTRDEVPLYMNLMEQAQYMLFEKPPKTKIEMFTALYEPIRSYPTGPGSWKVASFPRLEAPGPKKDGQEALDILVVSVDNITAEHVGLFISLGFGERNARGAVQRIGDFGYDKIIDTHIEGKKYEVEYKMFVGINYNNNETYLAYLFNSTDMLEIREFKAAFLEKEI